MTSERDLRRDHERDRNKVAELNRQNETIELVQLENFYRMKSSAVKIHDDKYGSKERWSDMIINASQNSTLLTPAEFTIQDKHGKRRTVKIDPKTSAHDVKRAIDLYDAAKYEEQKKREMADWEHSREEFGSRLRLSFSSRDESFVTCFSDLDYSAHTTPAHVTYHTSFRQPTLDLKLERENSRLSDQLRAAQRQLAEAREQYRTIEYENYRLIQENVEVSESLDSTQKLLEQISENRDEHVKTNRRYAEENRKLESELESAQARIQSQTQAQTQSQPQPRSWWSSARKVTFDDTSEQLREEVRDLTRSLENMKSGREPHNILRDVGVGTRLEFLQLSKTHDYPVIRHHTHHRIVSSSSNPELDTDLGAKSTSIDGSSLYGGNIRADAALLSINSSHRVKFEQTFKEIYGVAFSEVTKGCSDKYAPKCKVTEMANLRGTMAHLGCFTRHTPDKDADDRFLALSVYCEGEYEDIDRRATSALQAAKTFSSDLRVVEACNKMRGIYDSLVERTKSDDRRSTSFTGGGVGVADAEAAIRALKAQLVAQHGSFEQKRKTYKDREARLKQQLDEYKSKFLELEEKIPFLQHLARVGTTIRCRALEHAKGRRIFGEGKDKFTNIRGEVDMKVIKQGNISCHWGDIKADYSLYQLGYKQLQTILSIPTPIPVLDLHLILFTMMDPDLSRDALATLNEEESQLLKLHDKFIAINVNLLRAKVEHQQKLNNFTARKDIWYESVNQLFKSFLGLLSGGQTQLNSMKLTRDDIEVTLGTMKNMAESLMAEKSRDISTHHEQKKDILKSIDILLNIPSSMISTIDNNNEASTDHTQALVTALAENASLKLELAKVEYELGRVRSLGSYTGGTSSQEILTLKQKLEQVEDEKAELVLGLSATEDELESTRASLTDAYTEIESLEYKLNGKNHPNHDLRTLAVNVRLRFLNQATRRNNRGNYTAVRGRKVTDVGAIERGSAAVHGGDVRTDAFMIRNNIHNKFKDGYKSLFLRVYGVSVDEVSQGRDGKYRLGSKFVEIVDLRGTMSHCLSFSELSHDQGMDYRFDGLRFQCDFIYQEYLGQSGSVAKAQDAFNNDQVIDAHLITMGNIADHIVGLEKQILRGDLQTMTFLGPSTTKKGKGIKSSTQEDIRRPLALLSQNLNRSKPTTERPSSYITNESKKAISVLINQHEQAKSEL
ncbi:hypothetical protein BOTNAR_0206g00160 [Botryotinia narcissicola]|uniref:Uncharacterized protein n=1 Tax=Botryotinia narcissicola TaxID=278944 RepID=A0A4Z1IKK1_9HELO|nr:hypothetical protein BOTNAR_0206g00160 [Botryotinia narcissicola]